jgi:hypothetical protein
MAKGYAEGLRRGTPAEVGNYKTIEGAQKAARKSQASSGEGATRPKPTPMGTGFGGTKTVKQD